MDNKLFELCKSVYEKTGWKTGQWYENNVWEGNEKLVSTERTYPLYTSDYILEKLPKETRFGTPQLIWYARHWEACYTDAFDSLWNQELKSHAADTPLKALLKLTLALHEAGELK